MSDLFSILIGIVLANDLVLTRFLGPGPFLGRHPDRQPALAASLAICLALALSAVLSSWIDAWLLQPGKLGELRLVTTTLATVLLVPLAESALGRLGPSPRRSPGPPRFSGHVVVNSTLLAAVLVGNAKFVATGPALAWATLTGVVFCLTLTAYGDLRQRLATGDVPRPLRGAAITLLTGAMLSLAFSGLAGMLRE